MLIESVEVDPLKEFLATLRARGAVYIASRRYGALVIFGFYKDFEILIAYGGRSETQIEIAGLT